MEKGRSSCGKRSRAINIRYFAINDYCDHGELKIEHCSTDAMVGDFMTKPLQGLKFKNFRKLIFFYKFSVPLRNLGRNKLGGQ